MKVKVLIVVDDPIMGNLLEVRLTEANYDARCLETPDDALAAVSAADPSVRPVIVAVPDLPAMANDVFFQQLAAFPGMAPVIILLPLDDGESDLRPWTQGTVGVIPLTGPFSMETLQECLAEIAAATGLPAGPPPETATDPPPPEENPARPMAPGLPGLLTSFHERGITGLLEVRDLPEKAAIYLDRGNIVHAHYGDAIGEKALHRIIRAPEGAPQFHPQPRLSTETRTIREGFQALMTEAAREADALRRIKPQVFDSPLYVDSAALERLPEIRGHGGLGHILSLVAEHGRMRRVMDGSRLTDRQTYANLVYLLKKGAVRSRSEDPVGLRIVTDSAADLPEEAAAHHGNIGVIPLFVRIGGKTYRDGLDIGPKRFYELMKKTRKFPETTPPSPEDFYALFENAVGDADILGIFLSQALSDTAANARIAVDRYSDAYGVRRRERRGKGAAPRIIVLDSRAVSLGLGLLVAAAADKAATGGSLDEVRDHIAGRAPSLRLFFAVESLGWLHRSGRLGKGKAMAGSMLGIRPILGLRNGNVIHVDQVRGEKALPETLTAWIEWSLADPAAPLHVGIMHADAPERADRLAAAMASRFDCRRITMSWIGPAVGVHCGPGTLGVAVLPA